MSFRTLVLPLAVAPVLLLGSCSSDAGASGKGTLKGNLEGTGASFPEPLYQVWFREYHDKVQPGVRINYTGLGSSKGVRSVIEKTADFGASDAAMKDSEIAEVDPDLGVMMLPMTAGAVVVAYNAPIEGLRLDRATLAKIFMGEITRWDDAAIAATNAGKDLPAAAINVYVRSDGSGTTYAFSNHLSAISPDWKAKYGTNKKIEWPTSFFQADKNRGVTQAIQGNENSIGYLEFSYAEAAGLETAALQNKAGNFVEPTIESFQAGLAGEEMPENMRLFVPDPAGEQAFPIVTYTWILAYENYADANKAAILKDLLHWCLTEGQAFAADNGYVPLPPTVTDKVRAAVDTISAKS